MKIEWNKVTWYSKTVALVLLVALPFIGFWVGTWYQSKLDNGKTKVSSNLTSTSSATSSKRKINDITKINVNDVTVYKNDKWGYYFEIPKTWYVNTGEDSPRVTDGISVYHGISLGSNGYPVQMYVTNEDYDKFLDKARESWEESSHKMKEENNKIRGAEKSVNFTDIDTNLSYQIIAKKDNRIYVIEGGPSEVGYQNNPNLDILYKRFVDTFTLY